MKTNLIFWSYLAHFFFLEWKVFRTKFVEKIEARVLYSITFSGSRAVYEIMWKNIAERGRPQMTIWRMRIAYWVPKATNTNTLHAGYLRLQTLAHKVCDLLPFRGSNGCTNAPQRYVISTLTVFNIFVFLLVCLCVLHLCSVLAV